jgi:hypothetical protein
MKDEERQNAVENRHPDHALGETDGKEDQNGVDIAPSDSTEIRLETNVIEKGNANRCSKQPEKNGVEFIFKSLVGSLPDHKAKKDHDQKHCPVQECRQIIAYDEIVQDECAYKRDAEIDADSHHGALPTLHQFELVHIGKVGICHTKVLSYGTVKPFLEEINPSLHPSKKAQGSFGPRAVTGICQFDIPEIPGRPVVFPTPVDRSLALSSNTHKIAAYE